MKYIPLAARICLCLIFLKAGVDHLINFSSTQQTIAGAGLPLAGLLTLGTVIFLLVGSLFLLLGYKVRLAAILLIIFLIPTTLVFHNFFANPSEVNNFLKNVGLIGGLLMVFYTGPGAVSLDRQTYPSSSKESIEA